MTRRLWLTVWVCATLALGCSKREDGSSANTSGRGSSGAGGASGRAATAGVGVAGRSAAGQGGTSEASASAGKGGSNSGHAGSGGVGGRGNIECQPRDCVQEVQCATSCDAEPFRCCSCPEGTIDTRTCSDGGAQCQGAPGCGEDGAACCDPAPCDGQNFCHGALRCCGSSCAQDCATAGRCTIPCSGLAPDPQVQEDCYGFTNQADCTAYEADEFPYQCAWEVGPPEPCLAP